MNFICKSTFELYISVILYRRIIIVLIVEVN